MSIKFDLSSPRNYRASNLKIVANMLQTWYEKSGRKLSSLSMPEVAQHLNEISQYPRLEKLRFDPKEGDIIIVTPQVLSAKRLDQAKETYLYGRVFIEDLAAGEATPLKMGSKYTLTPLDLKKALGLENVGAPLPISLGTRHKLQFAFDLTNLAAGAGLNPGEVLKSQFILTVLNENIFNTVIREMIKYNFFGFDPSRMLFMVQNVYPGIEIFEGGVRYSPHAPWRLWKHGDIVMTSTMDNQIFTIRFNIFGEIIRMPLTAEQFGQILRETDVKISYPIEDILYPRGSIDLTKIGLALEYGEKGHRMIMEVVGQKPNTSMKKDMFVKNGITEEEFNKCLDKGILEDLGSGNYRFKPGLFPDWISPGLKKLWEDSINAHGGGFWAFDEELGRGVIIESDHGGKIIDINRKDTLTTIKHLNAGRPLLPHPFDTWQAVKNQGLMPHIDVKDGYLYPSILLGDQNFIVSTAFIREDPMEPVCTLEKINDLSDKLKAMEAQDKQADFRFREFAESLGVIPDPKGKITFSRPFIPILPKLAPIAAKSEEPLSLENFNLEMFIEQLNPRARDHLRAAFEICEVTGSLVRDFEIDSHENVWLKTIRETMKGDGERYPSQAMEKKIASDSKATIAKEPNRIYAGTRYEFIVIDITNKQSYRSGEIITLILRFKENIPKERIGELFANKINGVLKIIADQGISVDPAIIRENFLNLSVKDIFTLKASKLAEILTNKIQNA